MKVLIILALMCALVGYLALRSPTDGETPVTGIQNEAPKDMPMLAQVFHDKGRQGKTGEGTWWDVRQVIEENTSDAGQARWLQAYLLQVQSAKRRGGKECFWVAQSVESEKAAALISDDAKKRSVSALAYAIDEIGKPKSSLDDPKAKAAWLAMVARVRDRVGDDIELINAAGTVTDATKERYCDVVIAFTEAALSAPTSERGFIVRQFLNSHIAVNMF